MYFQDLILTLQKYWNKNGCVLMQPYDIEKGAGTFNPATFLRALGPEPFAAAYAEPCRRPTDGRYGDNPIRMQHYYQFQVILKPSPPNIVDLYLGSLKEIGILPQQHDIRFVHDDWETAALGAWGLGWEVWCDGTEVTQFTYFQQVGGFDLSLITGEITYGLERLCMFLQKVDSVFDLQYNEHLTYGDIFHQNEVQFSHYNFELANIQSHQDIFNIYEKECLALCEHNKPNPALDCAMKASHAFNVLDARGAISVNERQAFVLRIRTLAKQVAESWLSERERLDFPLLKKLETKKQTPSTVQKKQSPSSQLPNQAPLLIELGIEEMPSKVFEALLKELPQIWAKLIAPHKLSHEPIQIYATPRRIAIVSSSMATFQEDQNIELKGPPITIAKDGEGNWTKAALGFAKKNNIQEAELTQKTFGKAEYLYAEVTKKGRQTPDILAEIIPALFSKIHWYKTMRWADGTMPPFVRPTQWLVALLGDHIIPTEFGLCQAGAHSRGHRFLCNKEVAVTPLTYLEDLKKAFVWADHKERKTLIKKQILDITTKNSLLWREDESLLNDVTFLVEYPIAIHGRFKSQYLKIPDEVLVTEMKEHQKYFALNSDADHLHNSFIAISNMQCEDESIVREGYEKVLVSRLKDAEFFLKEDQKIKLHDRIPKLEQLTFEKKLGNMQSKSLRIQSLATKVGESLKLSSPSLSHIKEIATLCKADLTTAMVFEFTELQGIVGSHYATIEGLDPVIAQGINEHYLPKNATDHLPHSIEATLVGLADRVDTLVGFFGIGKEPTGSADPFALRRAAIGCLIILIKKNIPLNLKSLIHLGIQEYPKGVLSEAPESIEKKLLSFFKQRTIQLFNGFVREDIPGRISKDIIHSVLQSQTSWMNINDLTLRLTAMNHFRTQKNFDDVAAVFKRVNNILDPKITGTLNPDLFVHEDEKTLFQALEGFQDSFSQLIKEKEYKGALEKISALRKPVYNLFNNVLLNDKEVTIKINRHLLIKQVKDLVNLIADFSAIQDKKEAVA